MSDVWPPPPKNQPAPEPPAILPSGGFGVILCVSTGAVMMACSMFAFSHKRLFDLDFSHVSLAIVSALMLGGIVLNNLGGWLGSRMKSTKSGRVACALCFLVNIVFGLSNFLLIMYGPMRYTGVVENPGRKCPADKGKILTVFVLIRRMRSCRGFLQPRHISEK